jgi:hypothetical protein
MNRGAMHESLSGRASGWVRGAVNPRVDDMAIEKSVASTSLAEVVDRAVEKGVVIDAFMRVSLVGIELLAVEVRAVVASVETWQKHAEAIGLTAEPEVA